MKPPEPAATAAAGGNDLPEEIPAHTNSAGGHTAKAQPGRLPAMREELGTQGVREAKGGTGQIHQGQLQGSSSRDTPFRRPHVLAAFSIGPAASGHGEAS